MVDTRDAAGRGRRTGVTDSDSTESSGSVFAYLMARRGEIDKQDSDGRTVEIGARVPLVTMFDYADELRSLTQGRASSTLEPHAYAPAPDEVLRTFLEG